MAGYSNYNLQKRNQQEEGADKVNSREPVPLHISLPHLSSVHVPELATLLLHFTLLPRLCVPNKAANSMFMSVRSKRSSLSTLGTRKGEAYQLVVEEAAGLHPSRS